MTRRRFLASALALAASGLAGPIRAATTWEIRMTSGPRGQRMWFAPTGLLIQPGDTVRWTVEGQVPHTTSAYHPANLNHSLRIPAEAAPWNSGLLAPGQFFELTFGIEGAYDYCCLSHEDMGMVGRLVVGRPSGPGTLPFDYFREDTGWLAVPEAAAKVFPRVERIVERGRV